MQATQQTAVRESDEIDLAELAKTLWRGKWLIGAVTLLGAALAIAITLQMPNIYRAQALLAPSESQKGGGLAGLAAQVGGLASLAGVSLGEGKADKTDLAIEIAKSRQFVTRFIRRHQLEPYLLAATRWDKRTNTVMLDTRIYSPQQRKWVREVKEGQSAIPTDWELYKAFTQLMTISKDKKNGFVTLSIDYYSPYLAKRWADTLITDLTQVIKERDKADARRNIDFLKKQLDKTSIADMQTVFYQLIEEQTKTLMLTEVQQEYIFKPLDPPVVAEEKLKPKRALIVLLTTIVAFIAACFVKLVTSNHVRAS